MTRQDPPDGTAPGTTRRRFLLGAAGGAVAAALDAHGVVRADDEGAVARLPRRPFGRTGAQVSLFGLGCYPLGAVQDEAEAVGVVCRALAAGCTYLDTAPSYANGASERRVGLALKESGRQGVFLATKTHTRTRDDAWHDLEGSLKRLQVEQLDLLQIHAVKDAEDLAAALDERKGPLAALLAAREQKLVRFLGVTGHWDPAVMRQAFERFPFDAILVPLNCVDPHYETKAAEGAPAQRLSFVEDTLPAARTKGLARVAMKVFASGRLPRKGVDAAACLRFTYGLDVSTVIVGCKSVEEVDLAVAIAREDRPLSPEARERLLESTRPHRGKDTEWYKRP